MKKRFSCLLLSILIIFSIIPNFTFTVAAADYETELRSKGFPDSYIGKLVQLHNKYPNWIFEPLKTNLDWNYAVSQERSPHSQQLIQKTSSNASKGYYCTCSSCYKNGNYVIQEGSTWVSASESAVKYYMNPTNFLDEKYILQFESTSYNSNQTIEGIEDILSGTWMRKSNIRYADSNGTVKYYSPATRYSEAILAAAKNSGLSAYYLASKIVQEVGGETNSAGGASGTYSGYPGIYNYYNIGASTGVADGLKWASTSLTGYVTNTTCNMRQKPTTNSSVLVKLPTGTKLTHKSTTAKQSDGYTWEYVTATYNGKTYTGYIRSDLVNINGTDKYHRPWTNPYLSIYYGATYIANNFSGTQNTGYLQKFNVNPKSSNMFGHEYMANVQAAASEASISYRAYVSAGLLSAPKTFIIPVFNNMPNTTYESSSIPKVNNVNCTEKTGTTLDLSWNAVSGATGYEIQWMSGGNWVTCTTVSGTTKASISKLKPQTEYSFRIRAFIKSGTSTTYSTNWSDTIKLSTLSKAEIPSSLPAVKNVKLSNTTTNSFNIEYDSIKGSDGYQVEVYINGKWVSVLKTGYTNKVISNLTPATKYQVRVRAYVKDTNGTDLIYSNNWSEIKNAYTKPEQVKNVRTTWRSTNGTSIKIAWDAQNGADGYIVYKKGYTQWWQIANIEGDSNTELIINDLTPGYKYYYAVRAYKGGENNLGAYSETHNTFAAHAVDADKISNSLAAVKNIKVVTGDTYIHYSFDRVDGANGYQIQSYENGEWKAIFNTGYSEKDITGLKSGTEYTIRARAAYKTSDGLIIYSNNWSDTVTFYTKPTKVTNLRTSSRSADGTSIKIAWDAQNDADGYKVYKKGYNQWWLIATVEGKNNFSYVVDGLTPSYDYTFKVRAYRRGVNNLGAESSELKTYASPAQPVITNVYSGAANKISIQYTGNKCTGYEIMWSTTPDMSSNTKSVIVKESTLSATVTTAKSNTQYYIRVRAFANKGNTKVYSPWTGVKGVVTK